MSEIQYPCLMKSKALVVCFSSDGCGHVVEDSGISPYSVGHYSNEWVMDYFKPYTPQVEPEYYYQWVKELHPGSVNITSPVTDRLAIAREYEKAGWTKKLSSKTTLEELLK